MMGPPTLRTKPIRRSWAREQTPAFRESVMLRFPEQLPRRSGFTSLLQADTRAIGVTQEAVYRTVVEAGAICCTWRACERKFKNSSAVGSAPCLSRRIRPVPSMATNVGTARPLQRR